MIIVRKSEERRQIADKDQKTWMTFDSENKADPLQKGFNSLEILNEEIISPGSGFILHAHKDMIIVTYVREGMIIHIGPLEKPDFIETKEFHKDDVASDTKQYAFNVSQSEDAHVFQCGFSKEDCAVDPGDSHVKTGGLKKLYTHAERQGVLKLIASSDGRESSLPIHLGVEIFSTYIHKGNHIIHELKSGRTAWLHLVKGSVLINDVPLEAGDGAGFSDERSVSFTANLPAEILLFDLCGQIPEKTKTEIQQKLETAGIQ